MNNVMTEYESAIENPRRFGPQCTGALMLAVFRGKVNAFHAVFVSGVVTKVKWCTVLYKFQKLNQSVAANIFRKANY